MSDWLDVDGTGDDSWSSGGGWDWASTVGVDWGGGWGTGAADDNARGDNWLDDCARAVGDGHGLGSCGSVGNASVGDLSCDRAVGNVGSNDLSGVDGTVLVLSNGRGSESCEGEDGELHLEGWW